MLTWAYKLMHSDYQHVKLLMVTATELKTLISCIYKFHIDQDQWLPISITDEQNYKVNVYKSKRLLYYNQTIKLYLIS